MGKSRILPWGEIGILIFPRATRNSASRPNFLKSFILLLFCSGWGCGEEGGGGRWLENSLLLYLSFRSILIATVTVWEEKMSPNDLFLQVRISGMHYWNHRDLKYSFWPVLHSHNIPSFTCVLIQKKPMILLSTFLCLCFPCPPNLPPSLPLVLFLGYSIIREIQKYCLF